MSPERKGSSIGMPVIERAHYEIARAALPIPEDRQNLTTDTFRLIQQEDTKINTFMYMQDMAMQVMYTDQERQEIRFGVAYCYRFLGELARMGYQFPQISAQTMVGYQNELTDMEFKLLGSQELASNSLQTEKDFEQAGQTVDAIYAGSESRRFTQEEMYKENPVMEDLVQDLPEKAVIGVRHVYILKRRQIMSDQLEKMFGDREEQ